MSIGARVILSESRASAALLYLTIALPLERGKSVRLTRFANYGTNPDNDEAFHSGESAPFIIRESILFPISIIDAVELVARIGCLY